MDWNEKCEATLASMDAALKYLEEAEAELRKQESNENQAEDFRTDL